MFAGVAMPDRRTGSHRCLNAEVRKPETPKRRTREAELFVLLNLDLFPRFGFQILTFKNVTSSYYRS